MISTLYLFTFYQAIFDTFHIFLGSDKSLNFLQRWFKGKLFSGTLALATHLACAVMLLSYGYLRAIFAGEGGDDVQNMIKSFKGLGWILTVGSIGMILFYVLFEFSARFLETQVFKRFFPAYYDTRTYDTLLSRSIHHQGGGDGPNQSHKQNLSEPNDSIKSA